MGLLFGSLLGGFIGDKFGRKTANFLALAAIVPFTIGAGHVHSYEGSINIMNPNFIVSNFIMCRNTYLLQHMHVYIFLQWLVYQSYGLIIMHTRGALASLGHHESSIVNKYGK